MVTTEFIRLPVIAFAKVSDRAIDLQMLNPLSRQLWALVPRRDWEFWQPRERWIPVAATEDQIAEFYRTKQ
jgi:hypothetical protein